MVGGEVGWHQMTEVTLGHSRGSIFHSVGNGEQLKGFNQEANIILSLENLHNFNFTHSSIF